MPTVTLRPTGVGDATEHEQEVGVGAHWELMSDESDATYIWTEINAAKYDHYTHAPTGLLPGEVIDQVDGYARIFAENSPGWVAAQRIGFWIGGIFWSLGSFTYDGNYDVWFTPPAKTWITNPATGVAWTIAELDNAQFTAATLNLAFNGKFGYWGDIWYVVTYTTPYSLPIVTTNPATNISYRSAEVGGALVDDGGLPCEWRFEYGLTPAFGFATPWQNTLITGDTFQEQLTNLSGGVTIYFQAQAKNAKGVGVGATLTFTTLIGVPQVITLPATGVT